MHPLLLSSSDQPYYRGDGVRSVCYRRWRISLVARDHVWKPAQPGRRLRSVSSSPPSPLSRPSLVPSRVPLSPLSSPLSFAPLSSRLSPSLVPSLILVLSSLSYLSFDLVSGFCLRPVSSLSSSDGRSAWNLSARTSSAPSGFSRAGSVV